MPQTAKRKRLLWIPPIASPASATETSATSQGTMGDLEILDAKLSMSKSELLLTSLTKFFDVPEHREKLHDILEHRKGISLRKLEWFVTNYAKNNHVTYTTPTGKMFTVHVAYKSSLDGYSKKLD